MLSPVQLFVTPWTVVYQAPLSMGFSRQEYWSGLPFPSPGELPTQGWNLGLPLCSQILYRLSHQGTIPALAKKTSVFQTCTDSPPPCLFWFSVFHLEIIPNLGLAPNHQNNLVQKKTSPPKQLFLLLEWGRPSTIFTEFNISPIPT